MKAGIPRAFPRASRQDPHLLLQDVYFYVLVFILAGLRLWALVYVKLILLLHILLHNPGSHQGLDLRLYR